MGLHIRRILRSRLVVWSLALTVGWASASVVASARDEGRSWGRRRRVAVAVRPVAEGSAITTADVALRSLPVALIPPGAILSAAGLAGRIARSPLFAGQALVHEQIAGPRLSPTRVLIGRGRRGVAIATGDARPPLRVGDRVDVIAAHGLSDGPGPVGVVARNAEVVAVVDRSVTVAVDAHDAVMVADAMASGPLLLSLRGG